MTIIIDGVIGWDFTASNFRDAVDEAKGDNLDIQISSPGGSVFEGNTIFDLIMKYKKDFPNANITVTSFGISASQASIIALAGHEHYVYENTVYVIHNAWALEIGDHRQMRKTADILEKLSNMSARVYAAKSGKPISEIKQKQDDETYFYGQEIMDYGFADQVLKQEEESDKQEKISFAGIAIKETLRKIRNDKDFNPEEDLFKAVALIKEPQNDKQSKIPASAGNNNNTEVIMNLEQLKKDHPELYAQAVQIGKDEEFDRVQAHITMGEQSGSLDIAVKNIEERKTFTQAVAAEYMAAGMKNQAIQSRKDDEPDTSGGHTEGDDKVDTDAYTKKLLALRGVKSGK